MIHPDGVVEYRETISSDLCRSIREAFDEETAVVQGTTIRTDGFTELVDTSAKRCREYRIGPNASPRWLDLDSALVAAKRKVLGHYFEAFPYAAEMNLVSSGFQVQAYGPGDFFGWHVDGDGERHIALIAYLNDDFVGGQTEFMRQGFSYQPRTGTILVFPPFWTHPHRGAAVHSGRKYVVTSFMLVDRRTRAEISDAR